MEKVVMLIGNDDVKQLSDNIQGKLVVIKCEYFKKEYREAKYQLVKALSGFGCNAGSLGTAVFVKEVHQDKRESYRVERYDLLGEPTEKCLKEYEELYGKIVLD